MICEIWKIPGWSLDDEVALTKRFRHSGSWYPGLMPPTSAFSADVGSTIRVDNRNPKTNYLFAVTSELAAHLVGAEARGRTRRLHEGWIRRLHRPHPMVLGQVRRRRQDQSVIASHATAFEREIQRHRSPHELHIVHSFYPHNFANVFRHYKYMKACIFGLPVRPSSKDIPHLVDHG